MKQFFCSLFAAVFFTFLLFFPKIALEGASLGLNLWFFTLVPTLLPFLIFSNFLIQSHLAESLFLLPAKFTQKFFSLSSSGLYAMLCGFFFGYPSGAKILADLLKTDQISKKEASWLLGFCSNISPAFLITYFLSLHLNHPELLLFTFLLLYGIPLLLCLLPLLFSQHFSTSNKKKIPKPVFSFSLLDTCIYDAVLVVLKLGGYILIFAVLANAVSYIPRFPRSCTALFTAVLEITNGIPAVTAVFPYPLNYLLLLPLLGFGGFCALMQTGSVIKDTPLSLHNYFFCKILIALCIFVTEAICLYCFPKLF